MGARTPRVQCVAGVELTTQCEDGEAHLLAYAFDPAHPELRRALGSGARLDIADAIALVHRAGGYAFLAHPLSAQSDPRVLKRRLIRLRRCGLDGIEAFYGPYPEEQQQRLHALACRLGLLSSGGSDLHDPRVPWRPAAGVEMPTQDWERFRDAVILRMPGRRAKPRAAWLTRLWRTTAPGRRGPSG